MILKDENYQTACNISQKIKQKIKDVYQKKKVICFV